MSRYKPNLKLGDRLSPGKSSWTTAKPQPHSKKLMYWIDHTVCSGFPIASYSKTWMDCGQPNNKPLKPRAAKQYYHNKNLIQPISFTSPPHTHTHFHCCLLLSAKPNQKLRAKKPMDVVHKYAPEEQNEHSLGGWPAIQGTVKMRNSERDGNTRPPDLPFEKPVCRSGSNS